MRTTKLSVTVDREVAERLRASVSPRNVSRFVSEAIDHELELQQTRELLAYLHAELGPADPEVVNEARAAFDSIARPVATKKRARRRKT